jgi:hypothetical protein
LSTTGTTDTGTTTRPTRARSTLLARVVTYGIVLVLGGIAVVFTPPLPERPPIASVLAVTPRAPVWRLRHDTLARGETLNQVNYSVAGEANVARSLERNAELQLALSKKDYAPGEEIEIAVRAPYTGAGLITIERDHVYTWKWFKTGTNATVEHIRIPDDLEGGGYVAVTFIRDAGSQEVFMSPLSHGVVPFSISRARRQVKVQVDTPELARPGEPFRMKVKADKPSKVIVFAVDDGSAVEVSTTIKPSRAALRMPSGP